MATSMDACVVAMDFIEKQISVEIGIINNNAHREVHEIIKRDLLMRITSHYLEFYDSVLSEKGKRSSSTRTV